MNRFGILLGDALGSFASVYFYTENAFCFCLTFTIAMHFNGIFCAYLNPKIMYAGYLPLAAEMQPGGRSNNVYLRTEGDDVQQRLIFHA